MLDQREKSMEMSFFDSVFSWFREVGVSKRLTQAGYHILRRWGGALLWNGPIQGLVLGTEQKNIFLLSRAFLPCI